MTPAQQVRWEHYVDLLRVDLENLEEEGDLLGEESWLKVVLAVNAELTAMRLIVDSECPVGALDLVTSLRVEKMHMAEALAASDAIVQAAREYVEALAEVTRVYDAGQVTVGDAQAICESKTDALIASVVLQSIDTSQGKC